MSIGDHAVGPFKSEVEQMVVSCATVDQALNAADEIDSLIGWLKMWQRNALDRARTLKRAAERRQGQ